MLRAIDAIRFAFIAVFGALAACATPAPILTREVATVRAGVDAAEQQTRLSFDAANRMATAHSIDAKVPKPDLTIRREDFLTAVPTDAAARWYAAFDGLDAYLAAVQRLVDPKRSQATGDTLATIGNQLNSEPFKSGLPGGLVGIFSTFAQAVIQASVEKEALEAMRQVDPSFRQVTATMADVIGTNANGGVQGTVATMWDGRLSALNTRYGEAVSAKRPESERRVILKDYAESLAAKQTDLQRLASLQRSLRALGDLHSAAAAGSTTDAMFWLDRIESWLDDVKRRTEAAEAAANAK